MVGRAKIRRYPTVPKICPLRSCDGPEVAVYIPLTTCVYAVRESGAVDYDDGTVTGTYCCSIDCDHGVLQIRHAV